jgi:hypothetical protein
MRQSSLVGAWGSWVEFATWSVRSKAIMRRMLLRLQRQAETAAFMAWSARTAQARSTRCTLRKIVVRMQRGSLACALEAWCARRDAAGRLRQVIEVLCLPLISVCHERVLDPHRAASIISGCARSRRASSAACATGRSLAPTAAGRTSRRRG